jgi:hypothetical protein
MKDTRLLPRIDQLFNHKVIRRIHGDPQPTQYMRQKETLGVSRHMVEPIAMPQRLHSEIGLSSVWV